MESSNLAIKRFLSTFTNIILFEEPVLHSDILKHDFFFPFISQNDKMTNKGEKEMSYKSKNHISRSSCL